MTQYLKISSNGEIDPGALTLMGASSKRGDEGKIGFFGTGNKYAISCFLRNGIDLRVFSGEREINITTQERMFSGESIRVVYVDGEATSVTDRMGPTWVVWQAIRELYSNALDEGDAIYKATSDVSGEAGKTSFFVELTEEVSKVISRFGLYFSEGRKPVVETTYGKMYDSRKGATAVVYRKGIRCIPADFRSHAEFDYDLESIQLNEERIGSSLYMPDRIVELALSSDDPEIISRFFSASGTEGFLEHAMCQSSLCCYPYRVNRVVADHCMKTMLATDGMAEVMSPEERAEAQFISQRLLEYLVGVLGNENVNLPKSLKNANGVVYRKHESNGSSSGLIRDALSTLKMAGVNIQYPVEIVTFNDSKHLGLADTKNQAILLSDRILRMGSREVIATILEENIHLKNQVRDCTRAMQDAIFTDMANLVIHNASNRIAEAA